MWLVIPAKHSILAKSRLSPVLDEQGRAVLARLLLARLLAQIPSPLVTDAVVVSGDPGLRAIATLFGYQALPDPEPDLNASLEAGRFYAMARGARSVLILPTDLPFLTMEALANFIEETVAPGPRVVIARDRQGMGTNALFLRPANAIPFSFGLGSGKRHMCLAEKAGIPLVEVADPAFAYDLDSPEDWDRLVA